MKCTLRKTQMCYSSVCHASSDYGAIKKNHVGLLDSLAWKLATPSSIMPVLHVLFRSGTLVTGMDRVAEPLIFCLSHCMTKDELSALGRFARAFSTTHTPPVTSSKRPEEKENRSCTTRADGFCQVNSSSSLDRANGNVSTSGEPSLLHFVAALQFLLSDSCSASAGEGALALVLLNKIYEHIKSGHDTLSDTICLILLLLNQTISALPRAREHEICQAIFRCCVKEVHSMLPKLSSRQCALVYIALSNNNMRDTPFVLINEIEVMLLSKTSDDLLDVPTSLVLQLLQCAFVERHAYFYAQLCRLLYNVDRVRDMSVDEVMPSLAVFINLCIHRSTSMNQVVPDHKREHLLYVILARLFPLLCQLGLRETLELIEHTEVLCTCMSSVNIPAIFAQRLKRHFFDLTFKYMKQQKLTQTGNSTVALKQRREVTQLIQSFTSLSARFDLFSLSTAEKRTLQNFLEYTHEGKP